MTMREIKVRFWDEINNKFWRGGDEGESIGEECFQTFFIEGCLVGMMGESVDVGFGECDTIERKLPSTQYTGLKDKNGMEIYEGGIVKTLSGDVGEVIFSEGKFVRRISKVWAQDITSTVEVIGNIYEHPELLGDSQ